MILDLHLAHLLPLPFSSSVKPAKCPLSVALWGLLRMSPSPYPQNESKSSSHFAFTFSVLPPPTSLFLLPWRPSLPACLRCLPLSGHVLPALLFRFSFPLEPKMAQGEQGFLVACCLWGQATNMHPFGVLVFPFHREHLFRMQGLRTGSWHLAPGEWLGSRVLDDLGWKESVLGKAQMLWFVLGITCPCCFSPLWLSHACLLPALRVVKFEPRGAVL